MIIPRLIVVLHNKLISGRALQFTEQLGSDARPDCVGRCLIQGRQIHSPERIIASGIMPFRHQIQIFRRLNEDEIIANVRPTCLVKHICEIAIQQGICVKLVCKVCDSIGDDQEHQTYIDVVDVVMGHEAIIHQGVYNHSNDEPKANRVPDRDTYQAFHDRRIYLEGRHKPRLLRVRAPTLSLLDTVDSLGATTRTLFSNERLPGDVPVENYAVTPTGMILAILIRETDALFWPP